MTSIPEMLNKHAAETLRAAATKLRETASKATPGPWSASAVWSPRSLNTSAVYSYAHPTGTPESEVIPSMRATKKRPLVRPGDARWIALMSPDKAEPLAAWLEREAEHAKNSIVRDAPECPSCGEGCGGHDEQDFHDGTEDRGGCDRPLNGPDGHRCVCFDHALAFARSILGRTS